MRPECIAAVAQALGRSITQKEAQDIEARINRAMRERARQDLAAWRQLSRAERMQAAAQDASQELLNEAAKVKQRLALSVLAHDRTMSRYATLTGEKHRPFESVARVLDEVSHYIKGVSNEYFSGLTDMLRAVDSKYLGMVENAAQARDLVMEIFGVPTGNERAAKGARAWNTVLDSMVKRYNAAGGNLGKLDYSYAPQIHDDRRIIAAGVDQWVADILPKLDRARYIDEAGNRYDAAAMTELLRHAYETLATGGLNKLEPAGRANRGDKHRVLHFKDAESYLAYMSQYGKGGLLQAMQGHVARLANDIGMLEMLGPNPNAQWRFLHDTARKTGDRDRVGVLGYLPLPWKTTTQNMWEVLNGNAGRVVDVRSAEMWQAARNYTSATKLGSALLAGFSDTGTYFLTSGYNRLGIGDSLMALVHALSKQDKEFANRSGLIAESLISDMNRWAQENLGPGASGKFANFTMKASLLTGWTDWIKRAFSLNMMGSLGKMSRKPWAALHLEDRARLERAGIAETDFKVWQMAQTEKLRDSDMLTVPALRAISEADLAAAGLTLQDQHRAISKMLGFIVNESENAAVSPDLRTRAYTTQGLARGTPAGEIQRSIMLFKGFPLAMISRHWGRVADQWHYGDHASSVAYAAGLIVGTTILGALSVDAKDLVMGKDARDKNTAKYWTAAFLQGGGAGIFGDLFYTGMGGDNRAGVPNWVSLLGPVAGTGADAVQLTFGNIGRAIRGEHTRFGAESVQFARSNLPIVNLWYLKSAIDHAVLHDLQELLSPGYLSRMRNRARKDWGQDWWWRPGDLACRIAPRAYSGRISAQVPVPRPKGSSLALSPQRTATCPSKIPAGCAGRISATARPRSFRSTSRFSATSKSPSCWAMRWSGKPPWHSARITALRSTRTRTTPPAAW